MRKLLQNIGLTTLAVVGIGALGMASSTAHAQDEDLQFVMISHAPDADSWWNTVRNALNAAGEDMDVEVQYRNPSQGDIGTMARIVEQTTSQRPDGIIITLADFDVLNGPIREAIKRGIPVITINSGTEEQSEELGALMHVGQPEFFAGRKAGERAKENGVDKFLCVNHYITNPASVERCKGYAEGLGVEFDGQMIDSGVDPTEVQKKVSTRLRQNPDTNGVLTLGPASAHPTIRALKDVNKAGDIHFATFDASDEIVSAIENGTIDFAIDQQPYLQGYMPVVVLTMYNKYGLVQANNIRTGPGFVTEDNVDLIKELAGEIR